MRPLSKAAHTHKASGTQGLAPPPPAPPTTFREKEFGFPWRLATECPLARRKSRGGGLGVPKEWGGL